MEENQVGQFVDALEAVSSVRGCYLSFLVQIARQAYTCVVAVCIKAVSVWELGLPPPGDPSTVIIISK